jgi:hypothetical protein
MSEDFTTTVYPWGEGPGLSPVLDNPSIWADAVAAPDARRAIKQAAKQVNVLPSTAVTRIDNDAQIGRLIAKLLASVRGRNAIRRVFDRHFNDQKPFQTLGRRLLHSIGAWKRSAKTECPIHGEETSSEDEVVAEDHAPLSEFTADTLAQWAARQEEGQDRAARIALFACGHAMRQPDRAQEILATLLAYDNALTPLVSSSTVATPLLNLNREKALERVTDSGTSVPLEEPPVTTPAGAILIPVSDQTSSNNMFRAASEPSDDLSVGGCRTAIERLSLELEKRSGSLRRLDQRVTRIRELLSETSAFSMPASAGVPANLEQMNLGVALERTANIEQELETVLQLQLQNDALEERIGLDDGRQTRISGNDLAELIAALRSRNDELNFQLEDILLTEHVVAEFLEQAETVDDEGRLRLVRDADPSVWRALAETIAERNGKALDGHRFVKTESMYELLSAVLGLIWEPSLREAQAIARSVLERVGNRGERRYAIEALAFLSISQVQELGMASPQMAPFLAELILAAAIVGRRPELIGYLEPLLQSGHFESACTGFYHSVLAQWRRDGVLDSQLRHAFVPVPSGGTDRLADEDHRAGLLKFIEQAPGMSGTYHKLRVAARTQFLLPLQEAIREKRLEDAIRTWRSFGEIEEMVDACVGALGSRHPDVDNHHRAKTHEYLEMVQRRLDDWASSAGTHGMRERGPNEVASVVGALKKAAREGHPQSESLLTTLILAFAETKSIDLPPETFGQRTTIREGRCVVSTEFVTPCMVVSWPKAISGGEAELESVLADLLAAALDVAPRSVPEAVDRYLKATEYDAAREAAGDAPELIAMVEAAVEARRRAFQIEHAALLEQAEGARVQDELIDLFLQDVKANLAAGAFERATSNLGELETLLHQYKARRDPARQNLVAILNEGGVAVDDDATVSELERRLNELRREHLLRRSHIEVLQGASVDSLLPEGLRDAWGATAQRIDRPSYWPAQEIAERVAVSIRVLEDFLHQRAQFRSDDPETFDLLVGLLTDWIPEQLRSLMGVSEGGDSFAALSTLENIASDIRAHAPDARLFRLLGGSRLEARRSPATTAAQVLGLSTREPIGAPLRAMPPQESEGSPTAGTSELERSVRAAISAQPDRPNATKQDLRQAFVRSDWAAARELAASVARAASQPSERLSAIEVLYSIAAALSAEADDPVVLRELAGRGCLAVAAARNPELDYYLGTARASLIGPWLLLAGIEGRRVPRADQAGLQAEWVRVLKELAEADLEADAPRFDWLASVLYKASGIGKENSLGSGRLAQQIWELLRGSKDVAYRRSELLFILDRAGRSEALRHLAQSARPLASLVIQCLTAFERSRSDPEVLPLALQIAQALSEQSEGAKGPLRPWVLLFNRFSSAPIDSEKGSLTFEIDAAFADRSAGRALIEARATPTGRDVPRALHLELQVGGSSQSSSISRSLLEDEPLLKPRTSTFEVSFPPIGEAEPIQLAYRVTGLTVRDREIDVRGRVTVDSPQRPLPPLLYEEIERAWPGASGDPVTRESAFHGREREMRKIESLINASDRQRSAMVIGQRRIGKTSLLLELVRSFPPRQGSACGVFVDVSGLALDNNPGSMPASLFDSIVRQTDQSPENRAVQTILQQRGKSITRLTRDLDPRASFAAAVEGLLNRLQEGSGGTISRLALFIDEFDRFVNPWLTGRKAEVDALMWQLRQIVQRSQRVSIVLAGSGLQRLLVENYSDALYGSIEEVNLAPFRWESDRAPIMKTFLPPLVRDRLCLRENVEAVCRHAADICGGHPWYLAIFGRAAAIIARGKPLVPALLNQVLDVVTRQEPPALELTSPLRTDPTCFHSSIFLSLERLDERGWAIAVALLAHIAQRVTLEFPWLPLNTALSPPEISNDTTESERLRALNALQKEQVVEVDRKESRVRIRTPITAASLRDRGVSILDGALQTLREEAKR